MTPQRSRWRRATGRPLGKRGAVLLLMGAFSIAQGIGVVLVGDPVLPPYPPDAALLHLIIPVWVRVALWVAAGLLAIVGATLNPPRWERWAFMALIVVPLTRVVSFGWAWVVYLVTDGQVGHERGWLTALSWLGFVALLFVVSGWEEPRRPDTDTTEVEVTP